MRPWSLNASSAFFWNSGKEAVTSNAKVSAPSVLRSESLEGLRAVAMTLSPRLRASRVSAAPKPELQPVMNQTLPVMLATRDASLKSINLAVKRPRWSGWRKRVWKLVEGVCNCLGEGRPGAGAAPALYLCWVSRSWSSAEEGNGDMKKVLYPIYLHDECIH